MVLEQSLDTRDDLQPSDAASSSSALPRDVSDSWQSVCGAGLRFGGNRGGAPDAGQCSLCNESFLCQLQLPRPQSLCSGHRSGCRIRGGLG